MSADPKPPAGHRLVTPEDRVAHPVVPAEAMFLLQPGCWDVTGLPGKPWSPIETYAIPLDLWPEGDPAPEPATVQVPADLAEEIHERLADLADEMEIGIDGFEFVDADRAMIKGIRNACARLRACPGYGSDAARTVRKEAAP